METSNPLADTRVDRREKLLSICGGGFLGLYSALILEYLEALLIGPDDTEGKLHRVFQVVAGTSVGGILALGIAFRVPARELVKIIVETGTATFARPHRYKRIALLKGSLYSPQQIAERLEAVIAPRKYMNEVSVPVVIPALNLTSNKVELFKGGPGQEGAGLRVVDVAMATSAAPLYFPAAKIGGLLYADGGLVANAPDLIALHRANELRLRLDRLHLLSIGTTMTPSSFITDQEQNLGLLGWMKDDLRLLQHTMNGQMHLARLLARSALQYDNRYVCIDIEQADAEKKLLKLDSASDEAQALIRNLFQRTVNDTSLQLERFRRDWINVE